MHQNDLRIQGAGPRTSRRKDGVGCRRAVVADHDRTLAKWSLTAVASNE